MSASLHLFSNDGTDKQETSGWPSKLRVESHPELSGTAKCRGDKYPHPTILPCWTLAS